MSGINVITHKFAETIRDLITLREISSDACISFRKGSFKGFIADYSIDVMQKYPFNDSTFAIITDIFTDAFADIPYDVRVFRGVEGVFNPTDNSKWHIIGVAITKQNK